MIGEPESKQPENPITFGRWRLLDRNFIPPHFDHIPDPFCRLSG